MTDKYTFQQLSPFEGKRVILYSTEGDIIEAEVLTVFKEEQDLNYRVIRTNRPERYAGFEAGTTSYVIPFTFIADIKLAE